MSPAAQSGHIDEADLERYLKAQLTKESISLIDAHLNSCPMCVNKLVERDKCLWYLAELSVDAGSHSKEKRRHPRVITNDAALIQVLNPFSPRVFEGRIVNVSESGLRAYTREHLPSGSLIRVTNQFATICGDVRYCLPKDEGFYTGLRRHDYFSPLIANTSGSRNLL